MWKRIADEQPPKGSAVLLTALVGIERRYMVVPEWTEQHDALNKGNTNVFWQLITPPEVQK